MNINQCKWQSILAYVKYANNSAKAQLDSILFRFKRQIVFETSRNKTNHRIDKYSA